MENIPCSVCQSKKQLAFPEADYHLNLLPPLAIKRCEDCGFIFMSPRPDEQERQMLFSGDVPDMLKPYSMAEANYGAVTQSRLPFFQRRIARLIAASGKKANEIRFLDIGASSGYMVEAAKEAGVQAEGIEPSTSGVEAAKARGIILLKGTAEQLPFPDNHFDIVHSHHVFEHVADPLVSAKEAYRVLKPGGLVLIEVPNQFDNIRFWRDVLFKRVHQRKRDIRSIHHLSFFSKKCMRQLLKRGGFVEVSVSSKYTLTPKGLQIIPGYLSMLAGLFYLGGERVIGMAKK
ncbi:MAG: class I SAM-dependent methyltransferase [Chryseolinea sp.]